MSESTSENRSIYRLRWVGYGLLIFALLDVISVLIPPDINNPAWRLQAIGNLVERVVVPLIGVALVLFGEFFDRKPIEKILLKLLSWICLLLAIVSFILAPTVLLNTLGLDAQAGQQADLEVQQRLAQLKQSEEQITKAPAEKITQLATQLNSATQSNNPTAPRIDPSDPEKLRASLLARIKLVQEQTTRQAQATRSTQRTGLIKNTVKWALGAIIAGVLFFILWKTSNWAR
jgi:hypothetical protein